MERNKFRYFIKADNSTYYVVNGDTVTTTATKTPLASDPVKWDDVELNWKRNTNYHGVIRSFIQPATFPKDGAKILRYIFYTQGYNGAAIFEVEMVDEITRVYNPFYSAKVLFTGSVSNDSAFQIEMVDGGLPAFLKAKENTPFSIPISDSDCLKVLMDGVKLKQSVEWSPDLFMTGANERQAGPGMTLVSNEAPYLNDVRQNVIAFAGGLSSILTNNYIYTASYTGDVTAEFTGLVFMSRVSGSGDGQLTIRAVVGDGVVSPLFYDIFQGPLVTANSYQKILNKASVTFPVNAGDKVTFVIGSVPYTDTAAPSTNAWHFQLDPGPTPGGGGGVGPTPSFTLSYFMRLPSSDVRMYRQIQVWRKWMNQASAGAYGVVSSYLTNTSARNWGNNPYNTLMTGGDAARGLGDGSANPAFIKTTIGALFSDLTCRDGVGLGIEGDNIRIEPIPFFYDNNTTTFTLGLVTNFKVSCNQEWLYNLLSVGYQYNSNDTLNGKDDPFTTFKWGTVAENLQKENSRVSPFVASIYNWENMRSNLGKKKTTDDLNDSSILIAEVSGSVDSSGRQLLYRPQNLSGNSLSGSVSADTAFNLTLLPEYCLRRNGGLFHLGVHLMDATNLSFQTADQNKEVVTRFSSLGLPTVGASAPIPVGSLAALPFLPLLFEFETKVPSNFKAQIEAKPYGKIIFTVRNPVTQRTFQLAGFVNTVVVKPGRNMACTWQLLAAPDTDLSKLIF